MSDNIMDKLCKGCTSYTLGKVGDLILDDNLLNYECLRHKIKDINCPCINCLVKPMCESPCDDYLNSLLEMVR